MKILIFTEGTILMHKMALGRPREKIVGQVKSKLKGVKNYVSYIPIGNAVSKIQTWQNQGAEICYLTSRRTPNEIEAIRNVLKNYNFPKGKLFYRKKNEQYKDVAEKLRPAILIEDDCESIGGEKEMTYPHIQIKLKQKIKLIPVKEFGGIDHLPDSIEDLKL